MKKLNRKYGISVLTVALAASFGKPGFGQTIELSRAFSNAQSAISKPAAALQKKMKAEKVGFAASGSGETHFERLKGLYSRGHIPKRSEFDGFFFSGVCYRRSVPNLPAGAALKISVRPDENGPLFPSAPIWDGFFSSFGSVGINNSIIIYSRISDGDVIRDGNHEVQIRKNGAYILAEISRLKTDNGYRAGGILAECYFFKKD
jgi:hypothetical protein